MSDPVIALDGHTYERSAMEQWLEHHTFSPKTGEELGGQTLIPNHVVKIMIEEWNERQNALGVHDSPDPGNPNPVTIPFLCTSGPV